MTPKLSIITPIYNVARFLPKCLDSLISQTLQDIEFICVNDGSTDESLEILRSYAEHDSRFVVIDKPNGGYGHTMNTGLDAARGDYIGIVESDDWVFPDAFERLYEVAASNGFCDIVKANHNLFYDGHNLTKVENYPSSLCNRVLSPLDDDGMTVINSIPAIWAAIYKRSFLERNEIRFLETPGASFQDTGFVYKSWIAADSFVLVHDAFLNYRIDNASSSVKSASKVYFVCDEFASIEEFLKKRPERYDRLIGRVLAKKFDTYNWNYERISWEFRKEFLHRIADEFVAPLMNDEIDPFAFKGDEFERMCQIVEDPDGFFSRDYKTHKREETGVKAHAIADAFGKKAGETIHHLSSLARNRSASEPEHFASRKVSIIMPVYNAERYLDATVESLLNQTHKNIELICVNDGSKDNSLEILRKVEKEDGRLLVIDKENEGPSRARNIGISKATGDYICFVDSDDFVERTMLQQLVAAAETNEADVVVFGIDEYHDDTKRYYPMHHAVVRGKVPANVIFDPRSIDNYFVNVVGFTVNKLYRMKYFLSLDLEFPSIGAHEDMPFTYVATSKTNRVLYLNKVLYHYRRQRAEGSRSDDTEERYVYMQSALECMKSEFEKRGMLDDYERDFINYVVFMCRWKFETITGLPRQSFFDGIRDGWLADMGVDEHALDCIFEEQDRDFLEQLGKGSYLEMVERQNEQLIEALREIYESKSFHLSETIATPVRMARAFVSRISSDGQSV